MFHNIRHIAVIIGIMLLQISIYRIIAQTNGLYCETVISVTNGSKLYIGGDLITGGSRIDNTCNIFIDGDTTETLLSGNFIHNALFGNVFMPKSSGIFTFNGANHQYIKTDLTDQTSLAKLKTDNYIYFPSTLTINNNNHVTLLPEMAAENDNINLEHGWLILDSKNDDTANRAIFAHLKVNGNVNYLNQNEPDPINRGFIQVNMPFDGEHMSSQAPDYNNEYYRSLVGFGIPFKEIKADYFLFNFLMAPTHKSFLGDARQTIIDPYTTLTAGRGYAIGIDLRGTNPNDYDDIGGWVPASNFSQRATNNHYFNRYKFADDPSRKLNQLFGKNNTTNAYTMERLNINDVSINLNNANSYYYLANPFMTPLNINGLLDGASVEDKAGWNLNDESLLKKVWIMTGDNSKAVAKKQGGRIKLDYTFYVAQNPGGTYTGDYDDNDGMSDKVTIPPLQMFVVKTQNAINTNLVIPKSKRVMSNTKFIKSGSTRYDDFVFEVKDNKTGIADRVNIVLRPANEIAINKSWINVKKLSSDASNESITKSDQTEGVVRPTIFNQLYTLGQNKEAYTVLFAPIETTPSITLFMTPSTEAQQIVIRGIRLSSMTHVPVIYLEDKLEKKLIKMTPETRYFTYSNPNDRADRFIIHFKQVDENAIIARNSTIWANYQKGNLLVGGFDQQDIGSKLNVFDAVGTQYIKTTVTDFTNNITCELPTGVYIIRVSGKRNEVVKVVAGK